MRFIFVDRVTKLEKGKSIEAIKTFSLAEEFHRRHFGRVPLVPGVVLIESMAQALGWLINYSHDFKLMAIMSLLDGVNVSARLRPGFAARVRAEIVSTSDSDSMGKAQIEANGTVIASAKRVIYTHSYAVDPKDLVQWFRYCGGDPRVPPEADRRR
ncbi:MAG TPA: hypothetical protein VNL14_17825 [Candidatus Acidoferrales bacterium]|nr:hypothetical protein [Candidatus Acidoferrales bacterium]